MIMQIRDEGLHVNHKTKITVYRIKFLFFIKITHCFTLIMSPLK